MKRTASMSLAAIAVLFVGACGGGGKTTVSQAAGGGTADTTIRETEYALAPGLVHVTKAGTVTLTAQNAGKMTHALEIEGNGVEKKTAGIQPGSSATLTVDLKPGKYDLYCPIDGHRQLGMTATLTVGGASSSGGTATSTGSSSGGGTTSSSGGGSGY